MIVRRGMCLVAGRPRRHGIHRRSSVAVQMRVIYQRTTRLRLFRGSGCRHVAFPTSSRLVVTPESHFHRNGHTARQGHIDSNRGRCRNHFDVRFPRFNCVNQGQHNSLFGNVFTSQTCRRQRLTKDIYPVKIPMVNDNVSKIQQPSRTITHSFNPNIPIHTATYADSR